MARAAPQIGESDASKHGEPCAAKAAEGGAKKEQRCIVSKNAYIKKNRRADGGCQARHRPYALAHERRSHIGRHGNGDRKCRTAIR